MPKPLVAGNRLKFAEASALASQPFSCLVVEDGFLDLRIPMSCLNSIDSAIKDYIKGYINRFCDSLNGVLLAFRHLKLMSNAIDFVSGDRDYQELRVYGTFVIFRPTTGKFLKGEVKRVFPAYLGCLVHTNFNCSVFSRSVKNFHGSFKEGNDVVFLISEVEYRNRLCHLKGTLTKELVEYNRGGKTKKTLPEEKLEIIPATSRKDDDQKGRISELTVNLDYTPIKTNDSSPSRELFKKPRVRHDSGMSSGPTSLSSLTEDEQILSDTSFSLASSSSSPKTKKLKRATDEAVNNSTPARHFEKTEKKKHRTLPESELVNETIVSETSELDSPLKKKKKQHKNKEKTEGILEHQQESTDSQEVVNDGPVEGNTPEEQIESVAEPEESATKKKKRKRKTMEEEDLLEFDTLSVGLESQKKKSKFSVDETIRNDNINDVNIIVEELVESDTASSKKKKKRKSQISDEPN